MILLDDEFYTDLQALHPLIASLNFKNADDGEEIENFNMVTDNHRLSFEALLNRKVTLLEKMCAFRKPHNEITFEWGNKDLDLMAVVAFEPCDITFYKHKESGLTFSGALGSSTSRSYLDNDLFEETRTIKLYANDVLIFNPYVFRRITGTLIQVFYFGVDRSDLPEIVIEDQQASLEALDVTDDE